jgi:hypothetical protein
MVSNQSTIYTEVQYLRQVWWIMVLVLGLALLTIWGFVQQIILGVPWGTNPGPNWLMWLLLILFGIGFPLFFFKLKLILAVYDDHVLINYRPLTTREIPFTDIEQAKARPYNPIREYAGWGVKGWSKNKMVYNVKGKEGVELTLVDGRSVMIGSQQAQALEQAIQTQLGFKEG